MTLTLEFEVDDANEAILIAHQLAKKFGSVKIIVTGSSSANE